MILCKKAHDLSQLLTHQKNRGAAIGFVPTMGALHQGHLSLLQTCKRENDKAVCSIFINPTQFNNPDDFKHYPVTLDRDIEQLIGSGCDVLFLPDTEEIYPADFTATHYDLGKLESVLEGQFRPGHYQGVCQVMHRLLEIVQPQNLYLGAKDYQQCKVIERLLVLLGKQDEINIHIEPTLREPDGLAMSSRNLRLTTEQRKLAPAIFEALSTIKQQINQEPVDQLVSRMITSLQEKGFKVDYLQVADASTLLPAAEFAPSKIVLVAAYLGEIRLIDNIPL